MKILHNIRSKIWTCASISLLSYFAATLVITWVNNETQKSIAHIQQIDLPLSTKGVLVLSLFHAQSENYENALLTGGQGDVKQANMQHGRISSLLDELVKLAAASHHGLYPSILSLHNAYHDYFILASQYYMKAVQKDDIFAVRKEVLQLGNLRGSLETEFREVTEMMQVMIVKDLEINSQRIDFYTRLLQIIFILFLLITTIVINWLANKKIIVPLRNIKKMIADFSRGEIVVKPEENLKGDEIQDLAIYFWQMTCDLQQITVSRNGVDNIIDNMSDSLVILNTDLTIKTANHTTLNLLHASKEELEGTPFQNVFSHPKKNMSDLLFKGLLEGKAIANLETFYICSKEQKIPVLFSASPLYLPDGTLQGISCLARNVSESKEQQGQLEFLTNFDNLTGLPNRNLFFDRVTSAMNEGRRYGHLFALFYIDIDLFKSINATYGHEVGDIALQEVAKRLKKTVRDSDSVSRVGGDEFTVLLTRVNDASDAIPVATKIVETIGKPFFINGNQCSLEVSIGICLSTPELVSADNIMKNADTAMHAAKSLGRNRFMLFSSDQL